MRGSSGERMRAQKNNFPVMEVLLRLDNGEVRVCVCACVCLCVSVCTCPHLSVSVRFLLAFSSKWIPQGRHSSHDPFVFLRRCDCGWVVRIKRPLQHGVTVRFACGTRSRHAPLSLLARFLPVSWAGTFGKEEGGKAERGATHNSRIESISNVAVVGKGDWNDTAVVGVVGAVAELTLTLFDFPRMLG